MLNPETQVQVEFFDFPAVAAVNRVDVFNVLKLVASCRIKNSLPVDDIVKIKNVIRSDV